MKIPTLKKLLIFQETTRFNPNLKKLLLSFFRRSLTAFHRCSFRCLFSSPLIFTTFFRFSIVDSICSFHHFFFRCSYFTTDFTVSFWVSPTFLWCLFFVRQFVFVLSYRECYKFDKVVFTLRQFYFTVLLDIWHNLLLSRLICTLPWRLRNIDPAICLFESLSVQQNVLVGRFYLCINTLRNIILTSSRF